MLQHDPLPLLRFEPRYLCSVFNTSIYLICILLVLRVFHNSLGKNSAELPERRAVLPLLITFL